MTDYTLRMNRIPPPFRKTVTLAAAVAACTPFITATFTGIGNLTAYTPDLGAAFAVRATPENFFVGSPGGFTGGLAAAVRNTSGSWEFHLDNGIEEINLALKAGATPTGANYRQSIVLLLPATDNIQVTVALVGRGALSAFNPNVLNGIAAVFEVTQNSNTDRNVASYADSKYETVAPVFDSNPYPTVALGAAATVTLAAEWDGSVLRKYIDGVLINTVGWSVSTEFDAPGIMEWQFNFFDTGNPYTTVAVDEQSICELP